jgi:hypothetical protein
MPETWGLLDKSQVDNQKIDEAITEAIADHESDPDAHLESGESLQSHKASEIMDHKIGSVVADKLSHQDQIYLCTFESLDRWVLTGSEYGTFWPGVVLWADGSAPVFSSLTTELFGPAEFLNYSKNMLFQTCAWIAETANKTVIMGFGRIVSSDVVDGFGFRIINGTLYGYWHDGSTRNLATISGVDIYALHVYRAQYDPTTLTVTFYVDGVQKGTITLASAPGSEDGECCFYLKSTTTAEAYLNVRNVMISRDP